MKRENSLQERHRVPSLPRPVLMLVTEPTERIRLISIVQSAVAGGVNVVQLRDKTLSPEQLTRTAAVMKLYLPETVLLVNGCPAAAMGAHTHGVHLPEQNDRIKSVRNRVGPGLLIGQSVHSADAARKAEYGGADYIIAGTVFATRSHPEREPAGLDFLREVCAAVSIPVIAIGGITTDNAADCLQAGAAGIAVLSSIMQAADPRSVAANYRASLAGG